jgi:hypothetical protein
MSSDFEVELRSRWERKYGLKYASIPATYIGDPRR